MSTESLMVESVKKPTFCGDTKKGKKETISRGGPLLLISE